MMKFLSKQGIEAGSCSTPSCRIDEMCVADATNPTCVKHGKSIVKCPKKSFRKGNTCYKMFGDKKPWNKARDICVAKGSNLIEIHSTEDDEFIARIAKFSIVDFKIREGVFWTGLVYSSPKSAWIWDGSRYSLTYNMFSPTIPTKQDGMCMGVSYVNTSVLREWKSVNCNTTDIFMCQYEYVFLLLSLNDTIQPMVFWYL
ncbi:snaclec anticoagulant protein subunit B-like [Argopecten irradians]|uniref:snaclec anticoagulant protein subunit B-like n=1 Tax=Argopecten irradians TaxID=31199 RepID=UPI003723D60A